MSNVFENNLALLEKFQPYTYKKLISYMNNQYSPVNKKVDRILLAEQDGLVFNMLVVCDNKEYMICDHENPIYEAYRWIDRYIDPSNKAEIVFGMGFGYHLEVLLTSFEKKKVILVEPNIELFLQIMKIRNLEQIIKEAEIFVDAEINTVLNRIQAFYWDTSEGGIQCQPFEIYVEMFEDYWTELRKNFIKQSESMMVDISTRRVFGELWTKNYIENLKKIKSSSHAHGLIGAFKGKPGILVSAGPSLEKNVELLKDLEDKCVIMAAGTAVNILEQYGVKPHFMVAIDASEGEAEIHRKVKSQDIYLIYSNQVATGSLDGYSGPRFLMNYALDMYTTEFLHQTGVISYPFLSGPSVANTCFDLLFRMGCNPIILVGQDLALTKGSMYAGETEGEFINNITDMKKEGYTLTKDIFGNDVYSTLGFMSMKYLFEGCFERTKGIVEIINATEGGQNIEHARNAKLKDVIYKYKFKSDDITLKIRQIYESNLFGQEMEEKLNSYNEKILEEIKKLEEACWNQRKQIALIKRDVYHPAKNKKAFEKAIIEISKLTNRVSESPIYNSILKNLIEIEFFLIKMEFDRSRWENCNYTDAKSSFINAVERQNSILTEKLEKVKALLENEKSN